MPIRLRHFGSIFACLTLPLLACGGEDAVGATAAGSETDSGIDPTLSSSSSTGAELEGGSGDGSGSEESSSGPVGDPSCMDGIANADETDVDCGGPVCDLCGPGQACEADTDCDTAVCDNGQCQAATCYDNVENGNENGVDCGGGCPNSCMTAGPCEGPSDCDGDEFCNDGTCEASACDNEIQDTHETDIDCGGQDCPDCDDGSGCLQEEDCISGICDADSMTCAVPACDDGEHNGDETDTDCGGDTCNVCPNGADCSDGDDCASMSCDAGTCVAASCMDLILNGGETDIDCGGVVCNPCMDDAECSMPVDCESGVCEMGVCVAPVCDDLVHNGDETDIDCGGSCDPCPVGDTCALGDDCEEMVCEFTVCSAPDCFDLVMNGDETDVDCGGSSCGPCDSGLDCTVPADCEEGVCDMGSCALPLCDDLVMNGDETDEDCGNSCGATCIVGEMCDSGGDCTQGVCTLGLCTAPTCDDGIQNGTEGGPDCQGSCAQPCGIGPEVAVNSTTADFQTQSAVATAPDGSYWVVVWTSTPFGAAAQDGSGAGVFAQVYDLAGPVGAEIQVNTYTASHQNFPDVAADNSGFVVVWQSDGQDGDGTGIYGQRFDTTGGTSGIEFPINETTAGPQRRPSVAKDGVGAFVVCWDSEESTYEVYCRRFSTAAVADGGESRINTTTDGEEQLPVVARQTNGNYTVAWQSSDGSDGEGIGVFMRQFDSSGVELTAQTQVNQAFAGHQNEPGIAMNGAGSFVLTWTSAGQDASSTAVVARRYTSAGVAVANEFVVNTTTAGAQTRSAAAMNTLGDFWIAWQTPDDGDTLGVFGQRYDSTGAALGVEFVVNPTTAARQEEPDVAILADTDLIGTWTQGDVGFTTANIRQQRYEGEL